METLLHQVYTSGRLPSASRLQLLFLVMHQIVRQFPRSSHSPRSDKHALLAWIFQIAGTLTTASAMKVILTGGALPQNIVWVVAGAVTLGTYSHFEGVLLGATGITMNTGSSINGRLLAQTAVALQMATVTEPSS